MQKMIVDSREPKEVRDLLPDASVESLEIGDFASDDKSTVIERKDVNDLASSIKDGRYYDQIRTLMERESFFIVEGRIPNDLSFQNRRRQTIRMLCSAIDSLQMKYRIPTFRTDTKEETVALVKKIMKKRGEVSDLAILPRRKTNDPALDLFLALPGCGPRMARMLASRYGSFIRFVDAVEKTEGGCLLELPGIGKTMAEKLYSSLHVSFSI